MPKKFTSSRRWASAVSVNSTAPEMPKPALFTSTSMRPARSMISATAARTWSSSVMSQRMWCRPSTPCARRDSSYTVQPASFSASAVARPMPEVPPVTTATLLLICHYLPDDVHSLVQQSLRVGGHVAGAQQSLALRRGRRQRGVHVHAAVVDVRRHPQRPVRLVGVDGDDGRGGGGRRRRGACRGRVEGRDGGPVGVGGRHADRHGHLH